MNLATYDQVLEIHRKKVKLYFAITGGGTGAIYEFLRHGGASDVFVGATIPYDSNHLDDFLGGWNETIPEKACSEETAEKLAYAAFKEAKVITTNPAFSTENQAIGIGVTCSLAKATKEREGREHNAYIAIRSKEFGFVKHLSPKSTREEEEIQVAEAIIDILHNHCLTFPERDKNGK
jgi:nicotinamide mononucleotide (NMN) deamidase PncC